ncbi:hypothetical protein A3848_14010 [Paenibacillus sp. P32E]|nr:hypothetical protein A3848_14010 [Paenibacillus sp. P32E]
MKIISFLINLLLFSIIPVLGRITCKFLIVVALSTGEGFGDNNSYDLYTSLLYLLLILGILYLIILWFRKQKQPLLYKASIIVYFISIIYTFVNL